MTVSRNDPCPCGKTNKDGKPVKFKKCCLPLRRLQGKTWRTLFCKACGAPARIPTREGPLRGMGLKRPPSELTLIRGLCSDCWDANPTVSLPNGTCFMGDGRFTISNRELEESHE